VSIRDLLDAHESEKKQRKSEVHKLMSEHFETQIEHIVKECLNKGRIGFAVIIERESGNQNNPDNPWKWIDNTSYHIQRINQELESVNLNISITTKDEIIEIKRLLIESGVDVEDYFVHNLVYHFPTFGGKDFVDPDGDDGVRVLEFSDKVFNKFWNDGIDLYFCEKGDIVLEKKLQVIFSKGDTGQEDHWKWGPKNEGRLDTRGMPKRPGSEYEYLKSLGNEQNRRSGYIPNYFPSQVYPKYSLHICMF